MEHRFRSAALVCLLCLMGAPVAAQEPATTPAPKTPPPAPAPPAPATPPAPKPDELLRELEAARRNRPTIKPTVPGAVVQGLPGAVRGGANSVMAGRLVRQGTFLLSRRGTVSKLPDGEVVFTFDLDEHGAAERPMPLLPNTNLQNLERIADRADPTARFNVSGQVMAFKGRNYLLMDRPAEIVRAGVPAPTAKPAEPKPAEPKPAENGNADPAGMINKLEDAARERDAARPVLAVPAPGAAPAPTHSTGPSIPTVPPEKLLREGSMITSRRGRMIRQPDGDWALTFDADAAGKSEPALLLLPCMNLQAMERVAERGGEAATMSVSGIVTTYKSRNYLLPTMYMVNRPSDIVPGQ
ncbi:MAG: hypothetical protein ACREJO_08020 [Phycisphaerales bacterium]